MNPVLVQRPGLAFVIGVYRGYPNTPLDDTWKCFALGINTGEPEFPMSMSVRMGIIPLIMTPPVTESLNSASP